ncbi:MAG: hypothetical protein CSA54_05045, partial [Gammaproteobacteria bacterium]
RKSMNNDTPVVQNTTSHTFTGALKDGFQRIFDFEGRSSRAQYWWFVLWYIIITLACGFLTVFLPFFSIVTIIVSIALIIPMLAVSIRRLHDIDRTGWWLLISVVPIISLIIVYFAVVPGTDGPNRFGDKP